MRLLARMGVSDLRLTEGEPLVRRDFPRLVSMLARVPGIDDLSLTTNGYLLERDADALVAAGVTRVNVSIDSLQRDRFFQLTRRDSLPQMLAGLEAIGRHESVRPIKVNAVALRGFTEEEALPFAEFARSTSYQVRFIEFMPLDGDHAWTSDQVLTGEEIRAIVDRVYPLERPRDPHAGARVRLPGRPRRARLHQPGIRALLRGLQPHPPDRRRQAAHLPVLDQRDGPARGAPLRCGRHRARAGDSRCRLAQGAGTASASRDSASRRGRCLRSGLRRPKRDLANLRNVDWKVRCRTCRSTLTIRHGGKVTRERYDSSPRPCERSRSAAGSSSAMPAPGRAAAR